MMCVCFFAKQKKDDVFVGNNKLHYLCTTIVFLFQRALCRTKSNDGAAVVTEDRSFFGLSIEKIDAAITTRKSMSFHCFHTECVE